MSSYQLGLRNGVLVNPKLFILEKFNFGPHAKCWSIPSQLWSNLVKRVTNLYYLVRVITGRRPDGGIPLVYADREGTRGYGDHLQYDQD